MDDKKRPELKMVFAAVDSICNVLAAGNLVVLESTSPIGTTEEIARRIYERRPDLARLERARPEAARHRLLPRARPARAHTD